MVTVNGIIDLVEKARSSSTKRNLIQSFELIMTLKDLDTKKNELNINETVFLPNPLSRQTKICVFASGDLGLRAEKAKVDRVIQPDEIDLIGGNKRELRKAALRTQPRRARLTRLWTTRDRPSRCPR